MPAMAINESRPTNQLPGEMQLTGQIFTTGREMVFNARKQQLDSQEFSQATEVLRLQLRVTQRS
jgi:hypothetical protein